jgi:hypothetical protein
VTVTAVDALELSQVLGSLLGSVVEAQAESARATVEFVENVGFEAMAGGGEKMRTVKVRYSKRDEAGDPADFEVEVPLLTLVNVPALAVKDAKLSFSYDVVTAESEEETSSGGTVPGKKVARAKLKGYVRAKPTATTAPTTRRTTSIDLDVTLEQQEMPVGVERLFDLAELGITERPAGSGPP